MKKRMLALTMAFCLTLGVLPFGAHAQEEDTLASTDLPEGAVSFREAAESPAPQSMDEEYGIVLQDNSSRRVSSYAELQQAVFDRVTTVVFTQSIKVDLGNYFAFSTGDWIYLDLNGYSLYDPIGTFPTIAVRNNTKLTIKNGTVTSNGGVVLSVGEDSEDTSSVTILSDATVSAAGNDSGSVQIAKKATLILFGTLSNTANTFTLVANEGNLVLMSDCTLNGYVSNWGTLYAYGGRVNGKVTNFGTVDVGAFEFFRLPQGSNGTHFKGVQNRNGGILKGGVSDSVLNNGTITRFATWAYEPYQDFPRYYGLAFLVNDNTIYKTLYLLGENAVTEKPADPVVDGLRFVGWYDDDGREFTFGNTLSKHTTLTARFEDEKPPVISGLEDGKTYCADVTFQVSDNVGVTAVTFTGGSVEKKSDGKYSIKGPASGTVTVSDQAGNETSMTITVNADHTIKPANCQTGASCTVCGKALSEQKDPSNHAQEAQWEKNSQGHRKYYPCCKTYDPATGYEAHTFKSGVCEKCLYVCDHQGERFTWKQNAKSHIKAYDCGYEEHECPHDWSDGVCTACGYQCRHSGGKATCINKAKCENCGAPYGELNPDNHEKSDMVAVADGHYWEHECCGKNGAMEDHSWSAGQCSVCHYVHVCGSETGRWVDNGDKHVYVMDICGKWTQEGAHTPQTAATCTDKAVCQVCNLEYGEVDPNNHKSNPRWILTEKTHK